MHHKVNKNLIFDLIYKTTVKNLKHPFFFFHRLAIQKCDRETIANCFTQNCGVILIGANCLCLYSCDKIMNKWFSSVKRPFCFKFSTKPDSGVQWGEVRCPVVIIIVKNAFRQQ